MRARRSADRMGRLVTEWRTSGESCAGFARRHHIPVWTFWYWCRKLTAASPTPTFVPVRVTSDPETPVLEIVFSGGERLQVRAGAPTDLVRATLHALRSPC